MKNTHVLPTDKPSRLFDDGIELRWAIGINNLVEINVSDDIEFIVTIDDDISVDQVIEAKFISQYANDDPEKLVPQARQKLAAVEKREQAAGERR